MYYATTGGAADPFIVTKRAASTTTTTSKTNASDVEAGVVGGIGFLANIFKSVQDAKSSQAAQQAMTQAANRMKSDAVQATYLEKDKALDDAKQAMLDALTELKTLEKDLAAAQSVSDPEKAKGVIDAKQGEIDAFKKEHGTDDAESQASKTVKKWQEDTKKYEDDLEKYNGYQGVCNQLSNFEKLNKDAITVDGDTATAKPSGKATVLTCKKGTPNIALQATANQSAKSKINKDDLLEQKTKDGPSQLNEQMYNSALETAERLDKEFEAHEGKAKEYNELAKQKSQYGTPPPEKPEKPDPKNYMIGDMTAEDYLQQEGKLTAEKDQLESFSKDPKIVENLTGQINLKKTQIKTTLKTNLVNAQKQFDIAKKAFDALVTSAGGVSDSAAAVNTARESANSYTSQQNRIGGRKSNQDRFLAQKKKEFKQNDRAFTAANGYSYTEMIARLTKTQAAADQVNVKLKDADWQNIT